MNKTVTKAAFGNLIEMTFAQLRPETIINGFRACGLYFDSSSEQEIDFEPTQEVIIVNPTIDLSK